MILDFHPEAGVSIIVLAEIARKTNVSKTPVAKKPAELKSVTLMTTHVFVGPICSATAVNGATNADSVDSHRTVKAPLTNFDSLKTALILKRKSIEFRGRANAPNQHDATMTA